MGNEFVIKNGFISQGTSYITNEGKLGIGTLSPTSSLHIVGSDTSSSNYGLKVQNSGTTDLLTIKNNGIHTFNSILDGESSGNNNFIFSTTSGGIRTGYYGNTGYGSLFDYFTNNVLGSQTQEYSGYYVTRVKNFWSVRTLLDNKAHLFMDGSTGYVGIGDDGFSPTSSLHVKGVDSTSSNYGLKVQNSGGTDNLVVRNDGNVGIGTTNPTQKLHILSYGTGGVLAQLNDSMFDVDLSGSGGQLRFSYGANIEFMVNPYPSVFNTSFRFKSNPAGTSGENGIEHSVIGVINGNGGLVIGESLNIGSTSAYTGTYHSGTIYGKRIQKSNFNNPNATFYPLIVMDGNVGIGTTTPTETLDVIGKTKTDSLQIYNPYIPTGSTDPTGSIGDISLSGDVLFWRDSTQWYRISGQTW